MLLEDVKKPRKPRRCNKNILVIFKDRDELKFYRIPPTRMPRRLEKWVSTLHGWDLSNSEAMGTKQRDAAIFFQLALTDVKERRELTYEDEDGNTWSLGKEYTTLFPKYYVSDLEELTRDQYILKVYTIFRT